MEINVKKSILKKYRKEIWSKFIKAIKDYKLIKPNDKIAVCISGGKDSMLLAQLFKEYQKEASRIRAGCVFCNVSSAR